MADDKGGLTFKAGALQSLGQLHDKRVLHGDVELRNAVWRKHDGKVLWVDLEFAELRQDVPAEFEDRAMKEIAALDALLCEVPSVAEWTEERAASKVKKSKFSVSPLCCTEARVL